MVERDAVALELTHHRDYLLRVASLELRDRSLAEDVVQETLAAALAGRERFAGRASVRTWLTGILKLKLIDTHRLRGRETTAAPVLDEESTEDLEPLFKADGHFESPPQEWRDPARCLEEQRFYAAMDDCLERLPAQTARAFVLREIMDCETTEICSELAISANHTGVLLYRARLLLRECLEQTWFARGTGQ